MSVEADSIKGKYFRVLDHGFVSLVDYMGDDFAVADAARTSYGAGTKHVSDDRKLLRHLLREKHTGPFEQVELKFHVRLPIFVARQLIRHRTASVNEYSMRYSLPSMQFYSPPPSQMGRQSKKNKQGRSDPVPEGVSYDIATQWVQLQEESVRLYELLVSEDVDLARELARIHLPLSLYTEWYWKLDLHNLLHFLCLRCDGHAQWEIQQYANVKAAMVRAVAPMTYEAWIDYKFQSRTFSRMEMVLLRRLIGTSFASNQDVGSTPTHVQVISGDIVRRHAEELGMVVREWDEFMSVFDRVNTPELFEKPADFRLDMDRIVPLAALRSEIASCVPSRA